MFWLHWYMWRIKENPTKSTHVSIPHHPGYCPIVNLNNLPISLSDTVHYLGVTLDKRL